MKLLLIIAAAILWDAGHTALALAMFYVTYKLMGGDK